MRMIKGFREFIARGNVVDLAVAVVIGAAFNTVVQTVVDAFVTPIVGMFFNAESLNGALIVPLPGGGAIAFGAVLGAAINFLVIAAAVYFIFVLPMNAFKRRTQPTEEKAAEAAASEVELLTEIRDLLKKKG